MMTTHQDTAKGVDALIARLRDDGVAAGTAEAERIIADAQAQAEQIRAEAKTFAEKTRSEAQTSADRTQRAGEEALNTAMRDAILTMKATLMHQFEKDVQRMGADHMADPDVLKDMILELVGRAGQAANVGAGSSVILPAEVVGPEAIAANAEDIQSGALTQYVLGLTQELLQEGVTLYAASDTHAGIRVQSGQDGVALDLTDQAVAALLMQHLQPRFRAVLEGVIR
jgi:V/A-type H+-transporting ATPase subunit E